MEIYRRPATQFVAGFVGTPRINLVPVSVIEAGGKALARLPDGATIKTEISFAALPVDSTMTLGLRAEAVRITDVVAGNAKRTALAIGITGPAPCSLRPILPCSYSCWWSRSSWVSAFR